MYKVVNASMYTKEAAVLSKAAHHTCIRPPREAEVNVGGLNGTSTVLGVYYARLFHKEIVITQGR